MLIFNCKQRNHKLSSTCREQESRYVNESSTNCNVYKQRVFEEVKEKNKYKYNAI